MSNPVTHQQTPGHSVADLAELRGGCRHGLPGLHVEHQGERWRVHATRWAEGRKLVLLLVPADLADRYEADRRRLERIACGERIVITGLELSAVLDGMASLYPGLPKVVPASECRLLDRWPVVCCRPTRRRPAAAPR